MENSASAVFGQQQQKHEAAQQKSKKKPKNKRHNGKAPQQSASNDGEVVDHNTPPSTKLQVAPEQKESDVTVMNGLTEAVKQKLHIDGTAKKTCPKVNGIIEPNTVTAVMPTLEPPHHTRTATQNGHHHLHHTAISQQKPPVDDDDDKDDEKKDHRLCHDRKQQQQQQQPQRQQNHHQPHHHKQTTNGAGALPSTANNHNKKSKSKSNKSKNKTINDDDHEEIQLEQQKTQKQEQENTTHVPAHTVASNGNGTSDGQALVSPDNAENGFSSSSSSSSSSSISSTTRNSGNTAEAKGTEQMHNANDKMVADDVTLLKMTNQLSAHPAAAAAVSTDDAATSSNTTANKDSTASNTTDEDVSATTSAAASDPAQTTGDGAGSVEAPALDLSNVHIEYKEYESELQMHDIMRLIQAELSEPYSIYTYRYFIYNWPKLCFLAAHGNEYVGAIVCKLDMHMNDRRGYIAMLAVRKEYRKLKIGTTLVQKAIEAMLADNADEVVLETEMRNVPALRLYENLGFVRDKRLFRYYLNGVDALRLKLWFR